MLGYAYQKLENAYLTLGCTSEELGYAYQALGYAYQALGNAYQRIDFIKGNTRL